RKSCWRIWGSAAAGFLESPLRVTRSMGQVPNHSEAGITPEFLLFIGFLKRRLHRRVGSGNVYTRGKRVAQRPQTLKSKPIMTYGAEPIPAARQGLPDATVRVRQEPADYSRRKAVAYSDRRREGPSRSRWSPKCPATNPADRQQF